MATTTTIGPSTAAGLSSTGSAADATKLAGKTAQDVQDRFLTLLVTQMKNQDPLNPLDNAQLTTQLAQISTVTSVDQLHQTMKAVLDQIRGLESLQAAGMDGKDVLVTSEQLQLGANGAGGAFELTDAADSVAITIKNAAGATVKEMQLTRQGPGTHSFEWDGIVASGARAVDGLYSVTVSATTAGKAVTATTLARAHVDGVVRGGETVQVDLGLLGRKPLNEVKEIL
ncbi:MAG: flagellar hook assembly protein FlgD [Burkholderiales bacterium]